MHVFYPGRLRARRGQAPPPRVGLRRPPAALRAPGATSWRHGQQPRGPAPLTPGFS